MRWHADDVDCADFHGSDCVCVICAIRVPFKQIKNTEPKTYTVDAPAWVADESQFAVDDITGDMINEIHLDPEINYENYPAPSDLLIAVRDDLIKKVKANETRYANKSNYYSGKYFSASSKAISVVREWYVDQVMFQIKDKFTEGSEEIDKKIKKKYLFSSGTIPA